MATAGPMRHPHPHQRPGPPPVGPFHPDKNHSDECRWVCIYPIYFNSLKSKREGRILPKAKCVANPTYLEIRDVLQNCGEGFSPILEDKQHPRERSRELQYRGRIRVQLKNDDGTPKNPNFPTRESILLLLGEKIPQLKSRTTKSTQEASSSGSSQGQQKGKKQKKKK